MEETIAEKLLQSIFDEGLIISGKTEKPKSTRQELDATSPFVQFLWREKGYVHYEVLFYKEEETQNYKKNELYVELHVELKRVQRQKALFLRRRFGAVIDKNSGLSVNDDWGSTRNKHFAIRAGFASIECSDESEIEAAKAEIQNRMNCLFKACEPLFEKERIETMQRNTMDRFVSLLKASKQIVFTGAPGTGKTFLARQIARSLVLNEEEKGLPETEIGKLLAERISFVQFHPSYDYTDFVEGLRPVHGGEDAEHIGPTSTSQCNTRCVASIRRVFLADGRETSISRDRGQARFPGSSAVRAARWRPFGAHRSARAGEAVPEGAPRSGEAEPALADRPTCGLYAAGRGGERVSSRRKASRGVRQPRHRIGRSLSR